MMLGMFLETLGIGMVIPILSIIISKDIISDYPILDEWMSLVGNPTQTELILICMAVLVIIYFIKALFLIYLAWRQADFVFGVQENLSRRLFKAYLYQPWSFHLQKNSAELIRNIAYEAGVFTTNALFPGMLLISEILVLLGIAVLLFMYEPLGALVVVITLAIASIVFQVLTRNKILRWGKARQHHDGLRIQYLQEGLGGVKDVKLLGREESFISLFELHNLGSAHVGKRQHTIQQLPRLWLELLAMIGIASLVFVLVFQEKQMSDMLPTMGLFAAAAFRLMPSFNRVLLSVQSLRFGLPVINTLSNEIKITKETKLAQVSNVFSFKKDIKIENACYKYEGAERAALQNIQIQILHGQSVGFIGESGAGKSTLIDIFLGLLTPDSGNVKVDGINIQESLRAWQDNIGYVPQTIFLTDDSLRNNIAFGIDSKNIDDLAIRKAVSAAKLDNFISSLPNGLDTFVGERGVRLSGGQRQRIGIARALYHDPQVLVLDEATSALDNETEKEVMDAVNDLHGKKTILIIAHRLSTVKNCDTLYRMNQGEIIDEGSFEHVVEGIKVI